MDPIEARALARRALESLPERERELLHMHSQGTSYDEMAGALSAPRGSIGATLARARRRLAERLEVLKRAQPVERLG
jgi:RNA polymerase sigma factor (sigma-70 family)